MTRSEQEGILFFKLYLLARSNNYIDYMAQAVSLRQWFIWDETFINRTQPAIVFCGNCFGIVVPNPIPNGSIVHTCIGCDRQSNWAYELNRLTIVTGLSFHTCMYLLCKAVEEIYKYGTIEQARYVSL